MGPMKRVAKLWLGIMLDMPAAMLPALLFTSAVSYTIYWYWIL